MKMKNKINNKNIYKKTQKGIIPLTRKSGYFLKNEGFALNINKSWNFSTTQFKAIKLSTLYLIPKKMKRIWSLPPETPISKRQATRMGKGKGKIFGVIYKLPKNFKLFETWKIKNLENQKIKFILKNNFLYSFLYLAFIKLLLKYPFLYLKS